MSMKRLLIFSALLTLMNCSTANAAEKEICFLNIPSDRMGLARNLLLSDGASADELKEWNLAIERDVKFADISLNDEKNIQIALFIANKNYCSHYGCALQIWEYKKGKWEKILGTIAEKLSIQDKIDNGYHRLIEHRPIYTDGKWIERKPFQYIWNGKEYDSDGDENG